MATSINTKLNFHLLGGNMKVIFNERSSSSLFNKPEEYLLLTLDGLDLSCMSVNRSSDVILNIAHLQIEDAQMENKDTSNGYYSIGGSPIYQERVEIGNVFGFVSVS